MNIQRWLSGFVVITGLLSLAGPASAASKKKNFDLYSWAQEGTANYCYSLLTASKEARTVEAIKASKDQVCGGRDDMKRILGQAMPIGSKVTWKTDEANGLILPTRDIVNDLKRFCETIPYTLVVTEPK